MGLFLEGIEIENFRGMGKYEIEKLSNWSSITGSNSTSKSTLINAVSLLGANRMHTVSDIPTVFRPTRVSPREIPLKISYLFRITSNFLDTLSDERFLELLILSYEADKERYHTSDSDYENHIEMVLNTLKSKPLKKILVDSLYDTIRGLQGKYPGNPSLFNYFLTSGGHLKRIEDALNDAKYLRLEMELVVAEGPSFKFILLNQEKQVIVDDYLFFHWLEKTKVLESIVFSFAIGAVFIKSTMNPSVFQETSTVPKSTLAFDSSNIIEFIEYNLGHHPERLERIDRSFEYIFGRGIKIQKPSQGSFSEEIRIIVKLGNDENWFPLEKLSDGMFHALRILFQLESCKKDDILVIDEPELHLHPGAAKSLREILYKRKSELQIICATHSPIFIDPSYVDTCVLHRNNETPRILDSIHIDDALKELGSSGLDALLYDIIIWYEGPSDNLYLEKWIKLFSDKIYAKESSIGLIHFGGKNNLEHIKPSTIKKIARKSLFIIDSDKKEENEPIDERLTEFTSECNRLGMHCWVTERRAIENYIPINVLKDVLRISDDTFTIGKYDNVFEKMTEVGRNCEKIRLARSIVAKLTSDDFLSDEEFKNELKENLIDALNTFTE